MMNSDRLTIPGKVFLLGEYAVLDGGPAWVAAIAPRFRFARGGGESSGPFHPRSPVGRFVASLDPVARKKVESELVGGSFTDPWDGRGGFGGSTAEFAVAAWMAGIREPLEAYEKYRSLFPEASRPSGADLIAQWVGGVIEWNPAAQSIRRMEGAQSLPLVLFSATHLPDRKTKTHTHLESLFSSGKNRFESLQPILELARSGLERKDLRTLGTSISRYAEALYDLGLESEAAHSDRLAFLEQPGVLGAKGCGAFQTDAMIVLLDDPNRAQEIAAFGESSLGLKLVSFGLVGEPGIREETIA